VSALQLVLEHASGWSNGVDLSLCDEMRCEYFSRLFSAQVRKVLSKESSI
jgi:hypothetical protein